MPPDYGRQLTYIGPIDGTLTSSITLGQNETKSDGNKEVTLHSAEFQNKVTESYNHLTIISYLKLTNCLLKKLINI